MPRAQSPSNISTLEAFVVVVGIVVAAAVAHQTNNKKFIKERQENYTTNKLETDNGPKKVACHMANGMEATGTPRSNLQLRAENRERRTEKNFGSAQLT